MNELSEKEGVHPVGESEFTFPTPGGRVRLSVTEDALTPFGGLVPWAAFTKHIGIVEGLAKDCPVRRTSPNAAPTYDVIPVSYTHLRAHETVLDLVCRL